MTTFTTVRWHARTCLRRNPPELALDALLIHGHVRLQRHDFSGTERAACELVERRGNAFDYGLLGDALLETGRIEPAAEAFQNAFLRPCSGAAVDEGGCRRMSGNDALRDPLRFEPLTRIAGLGSQPFLEFSTSERSFGGSTCGGGPRPGTGAAVCSYSPRPRACAHGDRKLHSSRRAADACREICGRTGLSLAALGMSYVVGAQGSGAGIEREAGRDRE
jgi:hypothetical protein